MLSHGSYALLAVSTVLALVGATAGASSLPVTLALVAAAAAWLYVGYTRLPEPRLAHQRRLLVLFAGVVVIASLLMLRQPIFFVFMISGFLYATMLRPAAAAVAGVAVTSILVNVLLSGVPTTPTAWIYYVVIVVIQTAVIGGGTVFTMRVAEQNEERRETVARLEQALAENAGLHAQLLTQAREAGVLEERERLAREIHDTIAQGLTGVITQLGAARQVLDQPAERDRHLETAEQLARESLREARRSVEGALPGALEGASLVDALDTIARQWSATVGIPVDVAVTGDRVELESEIEVALLRTAQEALANVAKHAGAGRVHVTLSFMDDLVTLDVQDDGAGFDAATPKPSSGGFGLFGMRQRLARVAGTLEVESGAGGGRSSRPACRRSCGHDGDPHRHRRRPPRGPRRAARDARRGSGSRGRRRGRRRCRGAGPRRCAPSRRHPHGPADAGHVRSRCDPDADRPRVGRARPRPDDV
jgi:signal transduction histidine kinase